MIRAFAAAKINLYLDVIGRREDGFHEVETLYQPVGLWDELVFEEAPGEIVVSGDDPSVPWNEDNLCHKAARLILSAARCDKGLRIRVDKRIPPGGGLGGGSSDAAATLLAVNELFELGVSREALFALARELGSDVPFFMLGKPSIGRGRGEILEETRGLPGGWILIVKPDISISTGWAYQNLNLILTRGMGDATLTTLVSGLDRFPDVRLETRNSFEAGITERFPSVRAILASLRKATPILSSLSGSGSACFAVFKREMEAWEVAKRFSDKGLFTRVVQPTSTAIRFG
jgi:4-diphosphocytidyl-2-C-methyl-D-erythritol kinase